MRILITAGPTYEPIDPVRFIGNRSSGRIGIALAMAAIDAGHELTLILGPVYVAIPPNIRTIAVTTAREMHDAVLREFPSHDLLIMAAAVSDFRPRSSAKTKIGRSGTLTIVLEATEDILAAAGAIKRPDQRTIGFSLVAREDLARSQQKLARKNLDLLVHNPIETMDSRTIEAILLWPDGRSEELPLQDKKAFAKSLIEHAQALFA